MNRFSVREAYAGKSILITGGSGFLGKVLVEKLLHDVKDLKSIYFLLRGKRGQNFNERLAEFKRDAVFKRVIATQPKALDKLIPIQGDILNRPKFGISEREIDIMRRNVNFVIHGAATVKFDEPLEIAMKTNTLPSRNLLEIVENFENLESYIQVSTAFANTHRPSNSIVEEIIYDPVFDYQKAIDIIESGNRDEIQKLEEFSKSFPNTYTFSKYLVEQMINDRYKDLPITIMRPSIITPTLREPSEAWVNFKGTIMAVSIAVSQGVLRNMYANERSTLDFIPCDLIANSLIAAGAEIATSPDKSLRIYNCTTGKQSPNTIREVVDDLLLKDARYDLPSTTMLWYPNLIICETKLKYRIRSFLFQMVPASIFDLLRILQFKKPFYMKVQNRISRIMDKELEYFVRNGWNFDNVKLSQLYETLSTEDK
jgi:fatty acyl-CoA reductase